MKRQKIWVVGNKKLGASIEYVRAKYPYWLLKLWRNGRMTRQPEDFPTKAEAVSTARWRFRVYLKRGLD